MSSSSEAAADQFHCCAPCHSKAMELVRRQERGTIIGYLVWHNNRGSEGPIWSTLKAAQKFIATCRDTATYHEGAGYRVVVVSELPDGGTR